MAAGDMNGDNAHVQTSTGNDVAIQTDPEPWRCPGPFAEIETNFHDAMQSLMTISMENVDGKARKTNDKDEVPKDDLLDIRRRTNAAADEIGFSPDRKEDEDDEKEDEEGTDEKKEGHHNRQNQERISHDDSPEMSSSEEMFYDANQSNENNGTLRHRSLPSSHQISRLPRDPPLTLSPTSLGLGVPMPRAQGFCIQLTVMRVLWFLFALSAFILLDLVQISRDLKMDLFIYYFASNLFHLCITLLSTNYLYALLSKIHSTYISKK